jgi:hypothetical protein
LTYQAKDRRSRIRVSRWLAWGDKRRIWPPFEVRPWKRIWRMDDSFPDLSRLSRLLFSRAINNGLFLFDNPIRSRDTNRFPDTLYRSVRKSVHCPPTHPILILPRISWARSTDNDLPIPVIYFVYHKHFPLWK